MAIRMMTYSGPCKGLPQARTLNHGGLRHNGTFDEDYIRRQTGYRLNRDQPFDTPLILDDESPWMAAVNSGDVVATQELISTIGIIRDVAVPPVSEIVIYDFNWHGLTDEQTRSRVMPLLAGHHMSCWYWAPWERWIDETLAWRRRIEGKPWVTISRTYHEHHPASKALRHSLAAHNLLRHGAERAQALIPPATFRKYLTWIRDHVDPEVVLWFYMDRMRMSRHVEGTSWVPGYLPPWVRMECTTRWGPTIQHWLQRHAVRVLERQTIRIMGEVFHV